MEMTRLEHIKEFLKNPIKYWKVRKTLKGAYVFNPFRKWPRNLKCFCGSGIKFKKCCEFQTYDVIPAYMETETKFLFEKGLKIYQGENNA